MTTRTLRIGLLFLIVIELCSPALTLTENELKQLYLDVVEEAVTVFESLWVDDSQRIPRSGFFDVRKYDDWTKNYRGYAGIVTIPATGMVTFCYAVLLTHTDREFFTPQRIPRAVLFERIVQSLRWCALTSAYVENPYPYIHQDTSKAFLKGEQWRRTLGYRADEVGWLTLTAAQMWPRLDEDTKKLLEQMMVGGAARERLVRTWSWRQAGNHDQVKQDLSSTMGAAFLFPHRPDAPRFLDIIRGNGVDMVSTLHDHASKTVAAGRPLSQWARGWNLYPDYSSDHHGWAQIWYGADLIFEGRLYIEVLSRLTNTKIPETFTYEANGYDGVLEWVKTLALPEGEPASVHGMEYEAYYGAGLLAYCYGAVLKKDPVASALEEQAALLLRRHSRAIHKYDYHRNSWAKAALAYLLHSFESRSEPVSLSDAWQRVSGTYHYRWHQNLIHRDHTKFASLSWGTISSPDRPAGNGVCGFVLPNRIDTPEPIPLVYLHPYSLWGQVRVTPAAGKKRTGPSSAREYWFERDDSGFSSAGIIPTGPVDQQGAFFSFDRGPCVVFHTFRARQSCSLNWTGLSAYFYVREKLTDSRRYYDSQGRLPLEQKHARQSSWWCVEDELGMAVRGGNGRIEIDRSVGRNWARTDAYKDKCDGVFISGLSDQKLTADQTCGDLAAVIYTNMPHAHIARANENIQRLTSRLPVGWQGLVAPDARIPEKRYLVLVNRHGEETQTTLELTFPEGAPLTSRQSLVWGKKAIIPIDLSRLACLREPLELYLEEVLGTGIRARKDTKNRYLIQPLDDKSTKVRIRYAGIAPVELMVSIPFQRPQTYNLQPIPEDGLLLTIDAPTQLELRGPVYLDRTGPAVEIDSLEIREDGRITVTVRAGDKSGVREVQLFCDETPLEEKTIPPYRWNYKPSRGYHTFKAVATDNSPQHNRRASFLRTIEVP